jgi:hypothetical protein
MRLLARKLRRPHIWRRIFLERLTEPIHLNIGAALVAAFGSFRARVAFDLVLRPQHAFGLLKAADTARECGVGTVSVLEFGVASGAGLLNLCEVGARVTQETGVGFEVVGFDTGTGMPPPRDYRDHPEHYRAGDFPMDRARLESRLPANARMIYGDVARTVPEYLQSVTAAAPIGFVALDLDYYSSSREALTVFDHPDPTRYLPRVGLYLDDVTFDGHNDWCGELLAVAEFSRTREVRKIGKHTFLRYGRVFKNSMWIDQMYVVHILDHPYRSAEGAANRAPVLLENPYL